jgi:hypothetical protein
MVTRIVKYIAAIAVAGSIMASSLPSPAIAGPSTGTQSGISIQ